MKKTFILPELIIEEFASEDVIAASLWAEKDGDGNNYDNGGKDIF